MTSLNEIFAHLSRLSEDDGVYLGEPCTMIETKAFAAQVKAELGIDVPASYLEFLKHSDGLQINNASIVGTETFIDTNHEFRAGTSFDGNLIYLGSSGNIDIFFYDIDSKEFVVGEYFSLEKLTTDTDISLIINQMIETELQ